MPGGRRFYFRKEAKDMNETFAQMQKRLIAEEGLSPAWAAILAETALYRFGPDAQAAALEWMNGNLEEGRTIGGVSVAEVRGDTGATAFQAICILDSLNTDPDRLQPAVWQIWRDDIHE